MDGDSVDMAAVQHISSFVLNHQKMLMKSENYMAILFQP